ncbi:hypothetical protein D3C81_1627150 [compost metagenome]
MAGAQAVLQRNTLTLAPLTDALDHQLFRHRPRQFRAMITRQHSEQQVGHRHAATGSQAVTVPVEQVAGGNDLGVTLSKIVLPAPVHRRAVTVEQAKLGQWIHAGRQATHHAATARQLLECGRQHRAHRLRRLIGQQQELLAPLQAAIPRLARQAPSALHCRLCLQKRQFVDHIRMHPLGHLQHFLGQRQGQGLGAGPDEKTDSLGGHRVRSET